MHMAWLALIWTACCRTLQQSRPRLRLLACRSLTQRTARLRMLLRSMLLVDDIPVAMELLLLLLSCAALPMPAHRARPSRARPRSC